MAPHGRGETILFAEDEPLVRGLAVDMLEGANYRVLTARDGAEAEAIIRDHASAFQIAVLDVNMPHRRGLEVCKTLRAARPAVPVIFCSGDADGERTALEELSGRAILAKPYSRSALLDAVRQALDTPRSLPT